MPHPSLPSPTPDPTPPPATVTVVLGADLADGDGGLWVQGVFASPEAAAEWIARMHAELTARLTAAAQAAPTMSRRSELIAKVLLELQQAHPTVYQHLTNRHPTLPTFSAVGPLLVQDPDPGPRDASAPRP